MNLFSLMGKISLNDDNFSKGLATAENTVEKFVQKSSVMSKVTSGFKTMGEGVSSALDKVKNNLGLTEDRMEKFKQAGENIKSVGETMRNTGAVITGAVGGIATAYTSLGNSIAQGAERVNFSIENYQRWDGALKSVGGSMEDAEGDLVAFAERMTEADGQIKGGEESLSDLAIATQYLGVDLNNADGSLKTLGEYFPEFMNALAGVEDETVKQSIATALLSTTGENLLPILGSQAELNGVLMGQKVIDEDKVKKAEEFKNKWNELTGALKQVVFAIGSALIPVLEPLIEFTQNVTEKIADWADKNPELAKTIMAIVTGVGLLLGVVGTLTVGLGVLAPAFGIVTGAIGGVIGVMKLLTVANLKSIAETVILNGMYMAEAVARGVSTASTWLQIASVTAWNAIATIATGITTAFGVAIAFLTSPIGLVVIAIGALIAIGVVLYKNWDTIKENAMKIWEAIKTGISNLVQGAVDKVKEWWNKGKEFLSTIWNGIKTTASNIWNGIKDTVSTIVGNVVNWVRDKFNAMKTTVSNIWNAIKTTVSNVVNGIKDAIFQKFQDAYNKAKSIFDNIKNAIKGAIEGARDFVKGAIDKMKSFFNFKWELPKIKLPHFTITGKFSLSPPQIPKFNVVWKKDGGIMMNPTLFGRTRNGFLGGGEAGAEAILPLDRLPGLMKKMGYGGNTVINIENLYARTEQEAKQLMKEIAFIVKQEKIGKGKR